MLSEKNNLFFEGDFEEKERENLKKIINNKKIKIANMMAGDRHLLLIDDEKRIWSYGGNNFIARSNHQIKLDLIEFDFQKNNISQVSCGNDHSMYSSFILFLFFIFYFFLIFFHFFYIF